MQIQCAARDILNFVQRNSDLFDPPYHLRVDLKEYSRKLEKKANHFIIERNNNIVALSACYLNDYIGGTAYISYLCVDRNFQRMGLGKKILNEVVQCAQEQGFKKLSLEVDKINLTAKKFYSTFGFREETVKSSSVILTLPINQ